METTFTQLSQLDRPGLIRLSALHSAVMHTLLADLGQPIVLRYYECAQTDPTVIGFCAISAAGELDGWAIGCADPAALFKKLRQPPAWFAGQMLRLTITRPATLINLISSLFSDSEPNLLSPGQIELTYIGVSAQAQGRGIGKAMLNAFLEASLQAGYASAVISVEIENLSAIRLYTRTGFKITKTFREGQFERHRMERDLL